MKEEAEIRSKLLKHILYNVCVFIIIFMIFGLFVFFMVKNIVYSSIDNELLEAQKELTNMEKLEINPPFNAGFSRTDIEISNENGKQREFRQDINFVIKRSINPNVNIIVRDLEGEVESENLGRLSDYIDEFIFDSENIDKIYELRIADEYDYRCINVLTETSDGQKYVQLLINCDSQKDLIKQYKNIIISSVIICSFLSLIASYILSKKTLEPLKDNMVKQMEFVQNVSHELRTPLTIIQAKQELLLQEPNAKIIDKTEDIAQTLNETKRLSKLVKDLLILSRADANKETLQKESVNIDEYIKEIATPYIEIAELEDKKMKFDLNYGVDVEVDTSKFYQLMVILLDNALKYTESNDEIEISTHLKDNKLVIEVKDTGIGISDEGLTRVFERFYREDEARNRETGGTGLGLSLANHIVSIHNGTIKASHNNPKGTIFTIRLPR